MKTYRYARGMSIQTTAGLSLGGLFMALTILSASYGLPFFGTHVYLVDCVITTLSILFSPVSAMCIGGLGSFLGDMFFYPDAMFVSLVVHGLQAFVISWISHNLFQKHPLAASILGVSVGVLIVVVGYTLGHIYFYGFLAPAAAILTIPGELLQGTIGAISGIMICYPFGLRRIVGRYFR